MDPDLPSLTIADVVISTAGREKGQMFYVMETDGEFVLLADGKGRTIDKPKRKNRKHVSMILRSETRVAAKLRDGDKVLNSELRRDLAYFRQELQSQT